MGKCCSAARGDEGADPPGGGTSGDKPGVPYSQIRDELQSLDLLLFRGSDAISDFIRLLEGHFLEPTSTLLDGAEKYQGSPDEFSHVGMVVRPDILDDPRTQPGAVYVWESTMSGTLGDGAYNIDGVSYLGVQLRDLGRVVADYDAPPDTRLAVAPLRPEVRAAVFGEKGERLPEVRQRFTALFKDLNGRRYDANPGSLAGAMVPPLRIFRDGAEDFLGTHNWLFCSELVALVYRELGVFPAEVRPRNVIPMDLLGFDADGVAEGGVPVVVQAPRAYTRDPPPTVPPPPMPGGPDGLPEFVVEQFAELIPRGADGGPSLAASVSAPAPAPEPEDPTASEGPPAAGEDKK